MDVKVNQLTDSTQEVEVNLSYEEILPEIENAYKEERKTISIDGFRKGKAPMHMIKKLYGEVIENHAIEKISTDKFWNIVNTENLKPISTPQLTDIDFVIGSKLLFKVKYEVKPKLELKNYKDLEIEKPVFKIKEEDIEKEIAYVLKPYVKFETAEVIDSKNFRMTVNLQRMDETGLPIVGQRSENMLIDLSDEKVNPKIVENALNKKIGETFPFKFVDEHYHGEELHREEYSYEAEITKIEKAVEPEITEEIVKKISNDKAATIDELREVMKTNFIEYYQKQSEDIFTNNLLGQVVTNNEFTPPQGFVENLQNRMIEAEKENAKRYKVKTMDELALSEYFKPRAEWNAKWQLILENIAEIENIKVEDSDLEEQAKQESEKTGISVEKLIKFYKDTNRTELLLEEKVIKFLKDSAKIKEVDAEEKIKEKKGKQNEAGHSH